MAQAFLQALARPLTTTCPHVPGARCGHALSARPWKNKEMESLLVSTGVVALAEIGDKTQLLAFILAARFKRPLPIIAGILVATLVNHGLAGALGAWITSAVSPGVLRWVLGLSFIGMAVWTMIPDRIEEEETQVARRLGVFGATLVTFFLAEMGDKTQIATVAMAAHYATPVLVVIGTTLGMLIADVPAVLVGDRLASRIPMKLVHSIAATIFALLGIAALLGAGAQLGF
jgi:Ca2+/H+ antiporter, TMEM165/GDT1 family